MFIGWRLLQNDRYRTSINIKNYEDVVFYCKYIAYVYCNEHELRRLLKLELQPPDLKN